MVARPRLSSHGCATLFSGRGVPRLMIATGWVPDVIARSDPSERRCQLSRTLDRSDRIGAKRVDGRASRVNAGRRPGAARDTRAAHIVARGGLYGLVRGRVRLARTVSV